MNDKLIPFAKAIRNMQKQGLRPIAENSGPNADMNLDFLFTPLVRDVGRFTEAYAIDFLTEWKTIEKSISGLDPEKDLNKEPQFFVLGIRERGVDGYEFVNLRIQELGSHFRDYYRRLYVVKAYVRNSEYLAEYSEIHVELWEVRRTLNPEWFRKPENTSGKRRLPEFDGPEPE